jgi:hypothetical protein
MHHTPLRHAILAGLIALSLALTIIHISGVTQER